MTTPAPSYLGPVAYRKTDGQTPGIVFLHGYRSDMEGTKALALDEWTREWNHAYLRFDVRGHGLSQVDAPFRDLHLSHWLEDACNAFDRLTEGPQILVGSSMGGWLALLLAHEFPERVKHIVGVAAAPDFTHRLPDGGTRGEDGFHFGDDSFASDAFLEDGNALTLLHAPLELACNVTLLQGKEDDVVPWELAEAIKARLKPGQCTIYYIEDGDHRLNRPEDLALLKKAAETAL
jgi:pimeloyl-ACP methyl ester carboxylesterase